MRYLSTRCRTNSPRVHRLLATVLAMSLLLVACGDGDDEAPEEEAPAEETEEPATEEPETEAPAEEPDGEEAPAEETPEGEGEQAAAGPPEVAEVTVATIPIMAMAPFFHAQDAGIFEEEGLTVSHAIGSGGAELIPRLLSGEIDIFWTALEPFIVARSEGVELDLVAAGHYYEKIDGEGLGLFALPDSGFESIADLEGATIAINTLNTFGHIFTQAALEHQGVDLDSIRWVEIPFPQMAPALERGEVDAAWTPEPFITIMRNTLGAVPLLDPDASEPIMAELPAFESAPGGAWGATAEFTEANPNTVAAFARAIARANQAIADDKELGREVMLANSEMTEGVLEEAAWPSWSEDLDLPAQVQTSADLMVEYGVLDEPIDISAFMHETVN